MSAAEHNHKLEDAIGALHDNIFSEMSRY